MPSDKHNRQDSIDELQRIAGGKATLRELRQSYPDEWPNLLKQLRPAIETNDTELLAETIRRIHTEAETRMERMRRSGGNTPLVSATLPFVVRHRMATIWLRNTCLQSMADPDFDGRVRLAFWDGMIMQKTFFRRGFERRAVPMWVHRLVWPFVRRKQRGLMLYLVQQRGIYCFYSRELIRALAERIGSQRCLEIAAGDGTLTRLLKAEGVSIRATDNHEWSGDITYPHDVEKADAVSALRKDPAPVVLCSWPPANNNFEHAVFASCRVQLYIAIASARRFASGNWTEYRKQNRFVMTEDTALSRLVLPAEVEARVLLFERKTT